MSSQDILNSCNSKMRKAFDIFTQDLSSLRTGRANVSMLDIIKVDVYGQKMPINQLANISTPEARLQTVQVWDQNNVSLIDAAIKKSNLGINPQIDGQLLRIPIPNLNEERRNELKNSGKDIKIVDKIALGKLNKFIQENTLLNQEWIVDPKKKVKDVINEASGKDKIKIKQFIRFKVGEGL